jgi:hypothetical protein
MDTTLCDKVCQWFSPGPPVSSTNKADRHDIHNVAEILLKVVINTIKPINQSLGLHGYQKSVTTTEFHF